jgi:hypothetical protein
VLLAELPGTLSQGAWIAVHRSPLHITDAIPVVKQNLRQKCCSLSMAYLARGCSLMSKLRDMLEHGADSVGPNRWLEFVADIMGIALFVFNTIASFYVWLFRPRSSQSKE